MSDLLFVQFSDDKQLTIISYFAVPQDAGAYPNQGAIAASDSRWMSFYDSVPEQVRGGLPAPTTS